MNISEFEIFEYALALKRPFVVFNQPMDRREGLIVRLIADDGLIGVGEVAPLPGLSKETIKKALYQLNVLRPRMIRLDVPSDRAQLKIFFEQEFFKELVPSVRFGIESAVVHLMAQQNKCTAAEALGCASRDDIPVAGLVQGTLDEIRSQVQGLLKEGFGVFKLKVGNRNIPLDVQKVELLRQLIGDQRKIRLDANRAWSLMEAVAFAKNAGPQGIEFIEEPLKDPADLSFFIHDTGFPVALDETINDTIADKFVFQEGVMFVVIKPTVVGGILRTLDWIAKAKHEGRGVIISSAFESGVAGRMLANLSAFSSLAAGLGTGDWLTEDLLPSMRAGGRALILRSMMHLEWKDINRRMLKGVDKL